MRFFTAAKKKDRSKSVSSTRIVAITFLIIIFAGACLLSLPVASKSRISCGFLSALFTATSATCVTGLSLFDTYSQWSLFGQLVILSLIEIGGLGFMTAAASMIFLFRRRIGLRERLIMAQSLSVNDMEGVVRLQKTVLIGSLTVELLGAAILLLRFLPLYGMKYALWYSIFHSVSAFCNAGFDIFGFLQPGGSLIPFQNDYVVILTLSALIIVGGLGFWVWEDLMKQRSLKGLKIYTKLVLLTTGALLLLGFCMTCLFEWENPQTLGPMSFPEKILNAFFQSVTLRTAGFSAIDQGALTDSSKAIALVLMLIGGSSGSTAGGLKTVTFVVVLLFMWTRARGRKSVCVFKRTIPDSQVMDAMTISVCMLFLAFFGGVFLCAASGVSFTDALYESVSAIGTVGLTTGITSGLSVSSRILIIIYMYFGRVGILTISLGFLMNEHTQERFRYAQTNLLIG